MELDRIYEDLLLKKQTVLSHKRNEEVRTNFTRYCKSKHPDYYQSVCKVIDYLGSITISETEEIDIDKEKNRFFELIGM